MGAEKRYKVGYTDGVYDLFHVGHLNMIQAAKKYSEYLIVGVHGDDVVEGYKNRRPIIPEEERRRIIGAIKGVDRAEINRFRDKLKLWELYRFDVIFIGDDWKGTNLKNSWRKLMLMWYMSPIQKEYPLQRFAKKLWGNWNEA